MASNNIYNTSVISMKYNTTNVDVRGGLINVDKNPLVPIHFVT